MMTLSKIAKLANVSVSTASKAFSGSPEVNEETRQMIFAVAKEQGCFKKFYNAEYQKPVVAIIAPELKSAYYTRYISYIQSYLEKENCELCVSTTEFSPGKGKSLLEYYYKYADVDGIIMIDTGTDIAEDYEIPVVYVNKWRESQNASIVRNDLLPAMEESITYLLDRGVKEIGFIGERLTNRKELLFRQILLEKGITPQEDLIVISDERFVEGGYAAMEKLFAKGKLPRAIICGYDYMAIGAVRCILDHGLSVPGDIAVLGMDDVAEAGYLNPPLASISQCTEELCRLAAQQILRRIRGDDAPFVKTLNAVFCLRESFQIPYNGYQGG